MSMLGSYDGGKLGFDKFNNDRHSNQNSNRYSSNSHDDSDGYGGYGGVDIGGSNITSEVLVEGDEITNTANPENNAVALGINNDDDTLTNNALNVAIPVDVLLTKK